MHGQRGEGGEGGGELLAWLSLDGPWPGLLVGRMLLPPVAHCTQPVVARPSTRGCRIRATAGREGKGGGESCWRPPALVGRGRGRSGDAAKMVAAEQGWQAAIARGRPRQGDRTRPAAGEEGTRLPSAEQGRLAVEEDRTRPAAGGILQVAAE